MDKKDNPKALHTRKLKYSSEESEESEEEPQKRTKEPNLYKKVKVNSEGRFKKNVKPSEDKSRHRDEKSASQSSKRPETRSNHNDRKSAKPDQSKDNKKKQPPIPDRREKDKHDKKKEDLKKSKERAEPEKSSKREHSKEELAKQKNRNKTSSPAPPQKEKETFKKSVPPPKKNEKPVKDKETKEKDQHKQMKLDLLLEAKADKKNKTKTKAENESEKQFAEFTKKYPQYVYKGRFKFPIDDKLFLSYSTLLQEYIPATERPKPKTGFIPSQALGDILQIWNFFNSFPELFKCQDIQKEEIYASMKYDGEEPLLLLNDMHQGLLSLFTHEFLKKNRFDTYKDEVENPFFILIKHHVIDTPINGDELAIIWTEFARKLAYLPPYTDFLTETTKMFFDTLAEKTCKNYNKLEYRMKTRILISIIEALYETDVFKDFLQAKMDATSILIKERNDLEQEIRQEELDQTNLKNKIKTTERGLKKEEQFRNSTLRLDSLRKQRDPEAAKKELEENKEELEKLEESLTKKQTRLEEVNSELCMTLQTATFIGTDAHRSEYWIFQAEPHRLYVKHPEMVSGEEKWFYYDKKSEVDQLLKSLNVKGLKEKKLLQDLQDLLKNDKLKFEEDEEEEADAEKKQAGAKNKASRGRPAKAKDENKMEEEKGEADKNGDEEEEEEEDDYVVRKKEDPESAKKKMEEETEKPEKEGEEEEKKAEEAEKTKEQLLELEKEKQREKQALREKKKLEAEQQLTFEYWFAKIMEYEAPDTSADEPEATVTPRVTRRQHQQQQQQQSDQPIHINQPTVRSPKDLDIKNIKEMVNNTEKSFTIYLDKWEARWANPIIKEDLVLDRLAKVEDISEFASVLLKLNEYFQVSEAPRGRRGRPQRDRTAVEGDDQNKEGDEEDDDEEEDVDDEDEEEREEREREEYEREQERQEREEAREEWDSKRSVKSMEEENASENQSARLNQSKNHEGEGEGGMEVEAESHNEQDDELKATEKGSMAQSKENLEKVQKPQQTEASETREEENKDNKVVFFDERENAKKVKKFPIKFWGAFNGRLKKAWVAFTSSVDNLAALYFSADLLCKAVDTYVEKKSARYFTLYKTGKEYMAAKRRQKQEALAQKSDEAITQPTSRYQNSEPMTMESLDNYRHDKSRFGTRGNRAAARESQFKTRSMAEAEADTIVGRLRERFRPPKSYREPSYEYKPKFDERAARAKLDELANLRRSVRLTTMSKKRYDNLNEQQWDTECKACGKIDGKEMVMCSTCSDTYHAECAGVADLDVDREWTCSDCLQKIASQRRTRSSTRKLQL